MTHLLTIFQVKHSLGIGKGSTWIPKGTYQCPDGDAARALRTQLTGGNLALLGIITRIDT